MTPTFHYHLSLAASGRWKGFWVRSQGRRWVRHTPKAPVTGPGQPAD